MQRLILLHVCHQLIYGPLVRFDDLPLSLLPLPLTDLQSILNLLYCLLIHRSLTLIRVHSDTSPLILGSMALELRSLLVTIVRRHLIV